MWDWTISLAFINIDQLLQHFFSFYSTVQMSCTTPHLFLFYLQGARLSCNLLKWSCAIAFRVCHRVFLDIGCFCTHFWFSPCTIFIFRVMFFFLCEATKDWPMTHSSIKTSPNSSSETIFCLRTTATYLVEPYKICFIFFPNSVFSVLIFGNAVFLPFTLVLLPKTVCF